MRPAFRLTLRFRLTDKANMLIPLRDSFVRSVLLTNMVKIAIPYWRVRRPPPLLLAKLDPGMSAVLVLKRETAEGHISGRPELESIDPVQSDHSC